MCIRDQAWLLFPRPFLVCLAWEHLWGELMWKLMACERPLEWQWSRWFQCRFFWKHVDTRGIWTCGKANTCGKEEAARIPVYCTIWSQRVCSVCSLPASPVPPTPTQLIEAVEVICALHVALIFSYLVFIHVLLKCKTADETDFSL